MTSLAMIRPGLIEHVDPPPQETLVALDDPSLLALMLGRITSCGNPRGISTDLFLRFGSLAAIAAADGSELIRIDGMNAIVLADLKLLRLLGERLARSEAARRPVVSSWSALLAYVRVALVEEPREQFRALFLDKKNQLLRDEMVNHGTVDHAPVYNAGPARVERLGRVPDIAETRAYVATVVDCYLALTVGRRLTSSRQCVQQGARP